MGLFSGVLAPAIGATYREDHNFWFSKDPRSWGSDGISASPETSMRVGAVYACVRILADMVGYLPWHVYQRRADGGKDRAVDHPVYPLLRRRPNESQTAIRWRQLGMRHVLLRGNFYNHIEWSTRRARALRPLDPDRMTVRLLDTGRRGYYYRPSVGEPVSFTQDEIFHVMGTSLDGVSGCSVIEYAREDIGRTLAEGAFANRFYTQGGALKGALTTDAKLSPEARKANEEAWRNAQDGVGGWHKTALMEGGVKWQQIGISARDAQYIEGRQFSVGEIARWFGLPPHMIGDVDRSTSWGSGIEQQAIGFLQQALAPWLVLWEQEADRQLLEDDDEYSTEFLREALLTADLQARSQAHRVYVDGGILSVNEVRAQMNFNPVEGEEFEKPQRAQNIGGGGDPAVTTGQRGTPTGGRPASEDDDAPDARATVIALRAAERVVRAEIGAIQKWAPRYASNAVGWREWVCDFYGKNVSVLEEALGLDERTARAYGAAHTAELLASGVGVLEDWARHAPAALAAAALGEDVRWDSTIAA